MKSVEVDDATAALKDYAEQLTQDPIVLTRDAVLSASETPRGASLHWGSLYFQNRTAFTEASGST